MDYARLSAAYVDLLALDTKAPLEQLADEFGVSYETARNHVAEARRLGLLTGRGRGVAGGSLRPSTRFERTKTETVPVVVRSELFDSPESCWRPGLPGINRWVHPAVVIGACRKRRRRNAGGQ